MKCPVCSIESDKNKNFCLNCGWEFEYYLGELEPTAKADYMKRLALQKNLYKRANNKSNETTVAPTISSTSANSNFILWLILPLLFLFTINIDFVYGEESMVIRTLLENMLDFKLLMPLALYLGFKYGKKGALVIALGSLPYLIPFELSQVELLSYFGSSVEFIRKVNFINSLSSYILLLWLFYLGFLLKENKLTNNSTVLSIFFIFIFILALKVNFYEWYTLKVSFLGLIYVMLLFWGITGKYSTKVVVFLLLGLHLVGLTLNVLHITPIHIGAMTLGYAYHGNLGSFLSMLLFYLLGKTFASKEEKSFSYFSFILLFLFLFTFIATNIGPSELNQALSLRGGPLSYLHVVIALYLGFRYKKVSLYVALVWFTVSFFIMAMSHFDIAPYIITKIPDVVMVPLLPLKVQLFYIYFIYVGFSVSKSKWINKFRN